MKYLLLSLVLVVGLTGCNAAEKQEVNAQVEWAAQRMADLEAANKAAQEELRRIREDAEAEAAKDTADSVVLTRLAEMAAKLEAGLAERDDELADLTELVQTARAAMTASGDSEDFWWELGAGALGLFGIGAGHVLNNARKRNAERFRAVVKAFEKARKDDGDTFDMNVVGREIANAGIISDVEAVRKEVKA